MTPRMFIITKGERDQATFQTFRHMDPVFVTHDEERATRVRETTGSDRVLVSGIAPGPRGKINQQRWLFEHHTEPGEWVIVADDNITGVLGIPPEERTYWEARPSNGRKHQALRAPLAPELWTETLPETIGMAEQVDARMIGMASNANPLSRTRRWGTCSFVWGKLTIWKVDPRYRWDSEITVMEDWGHTATHLVQYGCVLVDYDTYMEGRRYAPGGLGTLEEREAQRAHDIAYLTHRYPGLFRVRHKLSGEADVALVRNRKTLPAWRRAYLSGQRARAQRGSNR